MASILDMLGGGGFAPTGDTQNLGGGGDFFGDNRNALIALGLGLMNGRRADPYGPALEGYVAGSKTDSQNRLRTQMLRQQMLNRQQDMAWRQHEADRAQSNADRSFNEQVRQFNENQTPKPSIHWGEDLEGNPAAYMVNPRDGSVRSMPIGPQSSITTSPETGLTSPDADKNVTPPASQYRQSEADESVMPQSAQTVQASPQGLPLNKKLAVKKYSEEFGKDQAGAQERGQAGSRVMKLADQLEAKIRDPLFAQTAGPMQDYASSQPMWNPARLAYEYSSMGPSKDAQAFMGQIKSDVQAINSELQRAYLSGQGSVTENERQQINDILGRISAARSPQEAMGLLNNFRNIAAATLQKGYVGPGGQSMQPASPPARPSGFSKEDYRKELIRRGVLDANSL